MRVEIKQALINLADKIGDLDIMKLPVETYPAYAYANQPPAYTDYKKIYIAEYVVDQEPQNIEIYIAHEIFHSVVNDNDLTYMFDKKVVNRAEDYKINQLIFELFGYDVKKVKVPGLFNKKYHKKLVPEIAADLGQGTCGCGSEGVTHPIILKVAMGIKERFLGQKQKRFFELSVEHEQLYRSMLPLAIEHNVLFKDISINTEATLNGLWTFLSLEEPKTLATEDIFTPSQALTYCFPVKHFRPITINNAEQAMLASIIFLEKAEYDQRLVTTRIDYYESRINEFKGKLAGLKRLKLRKGQRKRVINVDIVRMKNKIEAAKDKLAYWQGVVPLQILLPKQPVELRIPPKVVGTSSPTTLKTLLNVEEILQSPKFHLNDTTARIAKIANSARSEFKRLNETLDDLGDAVGGNLAGKAAGICSRLDTLLTVKANVKLIQTVITQFNEFITLLSSAKRKKAQDMGVPTSYTFGDDLDNVMSSELALLANEVTQLEFLSRYANQSLMLHAPQTSKRFPVVICIDCSGSMRGIFYEQAVGFSLAMAKMLMGDKRGFALIKFDTEVQDEIVIKAKEDIDLGKLIHFLCSPSWGGTDFVKPLLRAFDIKEEQRWKSVVPIIVTDGYDRIANPQRILERKGRNDKILSVTVSKYADSLIEISDEVYKTSVKGLKGQLVKVGKSLL